MSRGLGRHIDQSQGEMSHLGGDTTGDRQQTVQEGSDINMGNLWNFPTAPKPKQFYATRPVGFIFLSFPLLTARKTLHQTIKYYYADYLTKLLGRLKCLPSALPFLSQLLTSLSVTRCQLPVRIACYIPQFENELIQCRASGD